MEWGGHSGQYARVSDAQQAVLELGDEQPFVCPFCDTPLPGWPKNCYRWEHCDPRPSMPGETVRARLAVDLLYNAYE
jgi:hypothetical protein